MKYLRALTDAIKLRKAQHNIHLHAFIYKESMKRLTVVDYVTVSGHSYVLAVEFVTLITRMSWSGMSNEMLSPVLVWPVYISFQL